MSRMGETRDYSKVLGWVCLVLLVWSAAAAVVHVHARGETAAKCAICVISHSTPAATWFILPKPFIRVTVLALRHPTRGVQLTAVSGVSVRAPPEFLPQSVQSLLSVVF
ncbi:MAG: hypothetical protein ACRD3E_11925 [Terriglobales bacterium]